VTANPLFSELLLYLLLAVGAVGVGLALPRRGLTPAPVGGLIAAAGVGLIVLLLTAAAARIGGTAAIPNIFFYIFALVGLGGALRMITHPRPVYAALYFILTILASAGLFVLLAAEFVAFALVIIYAGAILITYLFVIMLATQGPTEAEDDVLAEYDAVSREPIVGTAVGFVLLAVLTTMMFRGVGGLPGPVHGFGGVGAIAAAPGAETGTIGGGPDQLLLPYMPGKVERALRNAGLMTSGERLAGDPETGLAAVDPIAGIVRIVDAQGTMREIHRESWPPEMWVYNTEGVGWDLLAGHPGAIEIAGIILLMAMLGAVVLARKQVQIDEEAKARHAAFLMARHGERAGSRTAGAGAGAGAGGAA
jgi:NADH-quinone oxidoreductase subunit J